jgi:glutathione peroxidase
MTIYDVEIKSLQKNPIQLSDFKGKHLLFVNVASKCGFTPQYKDLEKLHKEYADSLGRCRSSVQPVWKTRTR